MKNTLKNIVAEKRGNEVKQKYVAKLSLYSLIMPLFCHTQTTQSIPTMSCSTKINTTKIQSSKKKKILAFTSNGGGGHKSVVQALKDCLSDQYEIDAVNLFGEILASLDPIRMFTFNNYSGEDLYNHLLKTNSLRIANILCRKYGSRRILYYRRRIERKVSAYIENNKPDLLISVIPLANFALLNVAKKYDIPFMVITNDLDTLNYINGFGKLSYDKFMYTLAYNEPSMRSLITKARIPEHQIKVSGFPLRMQFYKESDKTQTIKDFNLPSGKPVVMLLLGAAGASNIERYVKRFARMNTSLHLLACVGRNKKIKKRLEKIRFSPAVSMSVIGYTNRMADLMAVSDLLVTKPGPNSISEAIKMNLPMLLDKTGSVLKWEKYNIAFVKRHGFGEEVRHYHHIDELVKKYLCNKPFYQKVKKNLLAFDKGDFKSDIRMLVAQMLSKQPQKILTA